MPDFDGLEPKEYAPIQFIHSLVLSGLWKQTSQLKGWRTSLNSYVSITSPSWKSYASLSAPTLTEKPFIWIPHSFPSSILSTSFLKCRIELNPVPLNTIYPWFLEFQKYLLIPEHAEQRLLRQHTRTHFAPCDLAFLTSLKNLPVIWNSKNLPLTHRPSRR